MKKLLLPAIFLNLVNLSLAQSYVDPNKIAPPSPNNTFSISNTGYNVNLYTGTASINVPLYTLASRELSVPVSLSYVSSRGIKVQDVSNYVGIGWQLTAGGRITRMVRGLPDDMPHGYIGTTPSGATVVAAVNNNNTTTLDQIASGQIDGEPDIFSVTTPSFSFQFTFDENGVPVFPNATEYSITSNLQNNSNNANTSIVVKDGMGNQYFFGTYSSSRENETSKLYNANQTFISTWYLDKIVSYNNKDQITFDYTSGPDYSVNHTMTTRNVLTTYGQTSGSTPNITGVTSTDYNTTTTTTYNTPKYISAITTSLGRLNFSYLFDRRDIANGARLTSLDVYCLDPIGMNFNKLVETFNFNYSYFGDQGTSTDPLLLRLRLDNISLAGNTPSTLAPLTFKTFAYNTSVNLPSTASVEFDYWGYYNTNTSGTSLMPSANKTPDLSRNAANILTGITDVSGETIQFQFEQNTYYDNASSANTPTGGLRIYKIAKTTPTGDNIVTQYSYNDENQRSTGQIYNSNYKSLSRNMLYQLNFCEINGQLGVCGATGVDITVSECLYNTYDLNGVFVGYSSVRVTEPNGGYTNNAFTNFSDYPDQHLITTGYQTSSAISLCYKRGLPINKSTFNSAGTKLTETSFFYESLNAPIQNRSYGVAPVPVYAGTSWNIVQNSYNYYYCNVENYRLSETITKEYDQHNNTNYITNSISYSYAPDKRQIKYISTADSKGNQILKTIYHADEVSNVPLQIPMVTNSEKDAINAMVAANKTDVVVHTTSVHSNAFNQVHYSYLPGTSGGNNIYLNSIDEYNNSTLIKQQFIHYDLNTSNIISVNETNGKSTSFQYGYNSSYPIAKVLNASSTSTATLVPTQTYGFVNNGMTSNFVMTVSGTITLQVGFGSYPGSNNSTTAYYTLSGAASRSGSLCYYMSGGCSPTNITFTNMPAGSYALYVSISTNYPNANPNVTYSFTTTYPSVSNSSEFFYEGFEQSGSVTTTLAHAGNAYSTGSYTVSYIPPNSRSYIIQWWNYAGGKWNFNESAYTANMTLPGPVDDIRVFPSDALMTTFAASPLMGATAETDPTGRTAYNEYDGLGRLTIMRDNDMNITSKTCYNYGWVAGSCSGYFTNDIQSGSFTRTNCGSNYSGGAYTTTVNAGKYVSYTSAGEANQWALNEVNVKGPQNANLYGSCTLNSQITLSGTETKGMAFSVVFTNVNNSSLVYSFGLYPNASSVTIGQLPAGNYNVHVCPQYNIGSYYTFDVNNYYQSGTGCVDFYNIPLSSSPITVIDF